MGERVIQHLQQNTRHGTVFCTTNKSYEKREERTKKESKYLMK